jgi:hypothetical protein
MFGTELLEGRKCKGKSISGAPLWLAAGAGHVKVVEVLLVYGSVKSYAEWKIGGCEVADDNEGRD